MPLRPSFPSAEFKHITGVERRDASWLNEHAAGRRRRAMASIRRCAGSERSRAMMSRPYAHPDAGTGIFSVANLFANSRETAVFAIRALCDRSPGRRTKPDRFVSWTAPDPPTGHTARFESDVNRSPTGVLSGGMHRQAAKNRDLNCEIRHSRGRPWRIPPRRKNYRLRCVPGCSDSRRPPAHRQPRTASPRQRSPQATLSSPSALRIRQRAQPCVATRTALESSCADGNGDGTGRSGPYRYRAGVRSARIRPSVMPRSCADRQAPPLVVGGRKTVVNTELRWMRLSSKTPSLAQLGVRGSKAARRAGGAAGCMTRDAPRGEEGGRAAAGRRALGRRAVGEFIERTRAGTA